MAVKLYCPNCYTANEYSSHPPKFCGECGAAFSESSASVSSQNPVKKTVPQLPPHKIRIPKTLKNVRARIHDDYDEDEQEIEINDEGEIASVPNIDKIEIESLGNYRPNTEKFGQVAGSGKTGDVRPRVKGKSPSKKAIKENWSQMFPNKRKSISIGPEE